MIINRSLIYWCPLIVFWIIWAWVLGNQDMLTVFNNYWRSSITMIVGSFVAGATPLGGGAVAFPVFTKLLNISNTDASTFSLLIQSVGMSFATLYFISKKTTINWKVIILASIGSFLSLPIGLAFVVLDNATARFIFSEFIVLCAFMMLWHKHHAQFKKDIAIYWPIIIGFCGGLLTAKIGSGCDAILYFYLVFICRCCPKDSIPTTVCFMAVNSLYASFWLLLTTTPSEFVIGSWWASAPIVSIGAPLGAYILSKQNIRQVLFMVITIISIEVTSSLLLTQLSFVNKMIILATIILLSIYTYGRQDMVSRQ